MKVLLFALVLTLSACEYTDTTRTYAPDNLQQLGFIIKTDVQRDEFNGCVTYLVTRNNDTCQLYSMEVKAYKGWTHIGNVKCIQQESK